MSLKPFRVSGSPPRIPRMSMSPSIVAFTELSWMPRFCATAATPAVRQLARPTSTYSTGVGPLSSDANTSGWSASKDQEDRWLCSAPSPKKPVIPLLLWVPLSHSLLARQVNCAPSGAPTSAVRASSSACTFTPLSVGASLVVILPPSFDGARHDDLRIAVAGRNALHSVLHESA